MILPPANHVVEARDLRVELGDIVTISEEPRNRVHGIGVPHSAERDRRCDPVALCANHVDCRPSEVHVRLTEWIGEQINGDAELLTDDVPGPAQFVRCLNRGQACKVWMAVGMRSNVHSAGVQLTYLLPVERDDVVGPASPEPLESPEDRGISVYQSGRDEERRLDTVLRQDRQRIRVIVLVPVVEGERDERPAAVVGVAVGDDVGQRGHVAVRLQPLHVALEDLRSRGCKSPVRVHGVIAEDDPPGGRVGAGRHSRGRKRRAFQCALPSHLLSIANHEILARTVRRIPSHE